MHVLLLTVVDVWRSKDKLPESGLSFYHEGTKLRTLGFGTLMLLPAEPFHPCRLQNFKSLFILHPVQKYTGDDSANLKPQYLGGCWV